MSVTEPHIVTRKGPPRLSDAIDLIPNGAEAHEMADAYDIGEALQQLAETGEPITIYSGRAREPVMARIDSVDPELPHFVLDLAGGTSIPRGIPAILVASLGKDAKMQFDLPDDWKVLPGQTNLVQGTFPEVCRVINRRSERRFETPVGGDFSATFVILSKKRVLPLTDFSMHGVGMRAEPQQAMGLRVGKKLDAVRLELGDETLTVDMEIRLARRFRTFLLGEQVQIGCKFINMTPELEQRMAKVVAALGGTAMRRADDGVKG
jgi:c-di-GMP-binding flagellar brake protein YcgR